MLYRLGFEGFFGKRQLDSQIIGIGLLSAVLAWLVAVPLGMVIWGSFRNAPPGVSGGYTLDNFLRAFRSAGLLSAMWNSTVFAGGSTLLSAAGGTFLAWVTERTDAPFKKVISGCVLFPLLIPGVLFATSWLFLLNPSIGILNKLATLWFGTEGPIFNGYSMGAMIWAHGVGHFGLPFLLMAAAFRSMDPSLEEAAKTAGAGVLMTLRTVTLPLLLPAVLAMLLISFIRSIETFDVPAVMGIPAGISVFATEVWLAIARARPPDCNLSATCAMG